MFVGVLPYINDILSTFPMINPTLSTIITILAAIILYIMIGINKHSLKNIKKRFEIYDKIIINNNKILSYTYLKDYLGCPISNDMIEYILESPHFYDLVTIWKNIYTLVDFDSKDQRIKYKNNKKPRTIPFAILYFIFISPLLLFIISLTEKLMSTDSLIRLFMFSVPFAIVAIFFFMIEGGNRKMAIKFVENLEKEHADNGVTQG